MLLLLYRSAFKSLYLFVKLQFLFHFSKEKMNLMFKVPRTGHYHTHLMVIAIGNR